MERNRETRRVSMVATNGLSRRRQRSTSLRDSPGSPFIRSIQSLLRDDQLDYFLLLILFLFVYLLQMKTGLWSCKRRRGSGTEEMGRKTEIEIGTENVTTGIGNGTGLAGARGGEAIG